MDKTVVYNVLKEISDECSITDCEVCPFEYEGICGFRSSPDHWDAEQLTEYLNEG